jgi:hypothetical protein
MTVEKTFAMFSVVGAIASTWAERSRQVGVGSSARSVAQPARQSAITASKVAMDEVRMPARGRSILGGSSRDRDKSQIRGRD